jgi:malonyl-CoA O-methyltransferase
MSVDKRQVALCFNRSVATYDRFAVVQREMAEKLVRRLREIRPHVHRVLEIGCGTGVLTRRLLEALPRVNLVAVDIAEKMVETARENIRSPRVRFLALDAESPAVLCEGKFDLIISNAVVQWLSAPGDTLKLWAKALCPGGMILFSTFGQGTFRELDEAFRVVEAETGAVPVSRGPRLLTAEEWMRLLGEAGFVEIEAEEERRIMEYKDCRHFLRSVKATGANAEGGHRDWKTIRHLLPRVMSCYDRMFRTERGVAATYHTMQLYGRIKSGDTGRH